MNIKKIWLVYPYGNIDGEGGRDSRYTIFGKELAKSGFSVCWWTANFSHIDKAFRCDGWKTIKVLDNFDTVLVPTRAYTRNISFKRIAFENRFKNNLRKAFAESPEKPDLILVASTGMFNAFEPCYSFSVANDIPIIYDIMDIPLVETYMRENHKLIAPIAKIVMSIERLREKKFFRRITGVTALGRNQLNYAIHRAFDRPISTALVYNGNDVEDLRNRIENAPRTLNLNKEEGWMWCVYSGSLGPQYDIETIIECAKLCEAKDLKVKFVVAGGGPQADIVAQESQTCKCLQYVGFVNRDQLAELYSLGDIGLIAIKGFSTCDMPDKFYDYCAAGLAILNTLTGEVKDYIQDNNLGLQYSPGNSKDLYEKVVEIISSNSLEEYKKNSYLIGEQFDIKAQVAKLTGIVESILS